MYGDDDLKPGSSAPHLDLDVGDSTEQNMPDYLSTDLDSTTGSSNEAAPASPLSIASLVCAIAGLVLTFFVSLPLIGVALSVAAVVMGYIALRGTATTFSTGNNVARAGLVIGWIGVGTALLICAFAGAAIGAAIHYAPKIFNWLRGLVPA